MQFNSLLFFVFFGLVLALYYAPGASWNARKVVLLIASYLFYAAWDPVFVTLLWWSTVVDWYAAHAIENSQEARRRRLLLLVSVCSNLGLLGYFKYGGFLLDSFQVAANAMGAHLKLAKPDIILPAGISFYTFQTLSYTIDVYRKRCRAGDSFLNYALYVTFFPQLVAGPIVRCEHFIPQCETPRRPSSAQFAWGMCLLILGIFEKAVLADGCFAPVVDVTFAANTVLGTGDAWLGAIAFTGQIFCDFAGYSTSAIGTALCLGFSLPDNFRFPYAAIGFSDFWRRWHISLSTWLRDYLYIPLGGNRHGPTRTQISLMLTMLIGGLWHGASWTFVAWGGLHGLFLIVERGLKQLVRPRAWFASPAFRALLGAATLLCVAIAWVFFRARTFKQAFDILSAMLGLHPTSSDHVTRADTSLVLATFGALIALHCLMRNRSLEITVERTPWPLRATAIAAALVAIVCMTAEDNRAFIYFQF